MTPATKPIPVRELLVRVQSALGMTQQQLADVLGCSRRTIIRYQQHGGPLIPSEYKKLAAACHPRDRELAAYLAAAAGETLTSLQLEHPAPPPAAPVAPDVRHMVDSVVCAGAEAMSTTPQAMRVGLIAAFERAIALGMTAQEALSAMAPSGDGKAPSKSSRK